MTSGYYYYEGVFTISFSRVGLVLGFGTNGNGFTDFYCTNIDTRGLSATLRIRDNNTKTFSCI